MDKSAQGLLSYENPVTQAVLDWFGGDLSMSAVIYMYAVAAVLGVFGFLAAKNPNPLRTMLLGAGIAGLIGLTPVLVRAFVEAGAMIADPEGPKAAPPAEEMAGHVRASMAVSWLLLALGFWLWGVACTTWVTVSSRRSLHRAASKNEPCRVGQEKRPALELVRPLTEPKPVTEDHYRGDPQ